MKKICFLMMALILALSASAFPKAIYVKKGDTYMKYNFGVAGALKFLDGGKKLQITGYNEAIDLDNVDYVTFTAPVMSGLTPKASKERMIQIGHEALTVLDAKDEASLTKAIDTYIRFQSYCDFPDEWKEVEYEEVFTNIMKNISNMAESNSIAATRETARISSNIYRLNDYYGVYSAKIHQSNYGDYEGEWKKIADADYFEFRYSNPVDFSSYTLTLVPSNSYSEWVEEEGTLRIPNKIEITIKEEGNEVCTATITNDVRQDIKVVKTSMTMKSNSIDLDYHCNVTNSDVTESTIIKIKGKDYVKTNTHVNGKDLLDRESWDKIYEKFEEEEYYDKNLGIWVWPENEAGAMTAAKFYNGTFECDVIGKLQVKCRLSQVPKLYDVLAEDSDDDSEEKTICEKHVLYLNNYSDATFYYDGLPTPQGYIVWDLSEEECDYSHSYHYYTVPFLTFPDMTSFYFDDYFTVGGFSSLIDDLESLIKSYCNVTGNTFFPLRD